MTRGDPMSPLRWTCKSAAKLAAELQAQGHAASERTVNRLLHALGLQPPVQPEDDRGQAATRTGMPNSSTSTGGSRRSRGRGSRWCRSMPRRRSWWANSATAAGSGNPRGSPRRWRSTTSSSKDLGKAIPYGIYDQTANTGWVSVGIDHDTAEFAVETLRRWWRNMGSQVYPQAKQLLITADGGGSNGSRCRLWKVELQGLADETGLRISVCHFPPGTSKWNKIEHRMFCHITENWRGRPLVSREVVVNLIGHTTTKTGLAIQSELDEGNYPTGREVSDEQMEGLSIRRDKFHGEWNYTILPRQ